MRKKLRTHLLKIPTISAPGHATQGLQPSAQEVAQWCATSCALFRLILAENPFGLSKNASTI